MSIFGDLGFGGRVVSMAEKLGRGAAHPALAQLRGYWEALRAGGALPTRAEIDPRGIESALEFAFIAERVAPGVARFRLAGMHLNDLMGAEVRGMPITTFFEPESRDEVQRQVERAFLGQVALELTLESTRSMGRPALTAQLVLLPLRTETGDVARVLGGLVAEGGIGRAPRRFRLVAAAAAGVSEDWAAAPAAAAAPRAETPAAAASPAPAPVPATIAGFAEPELRFEGAATPRGRKHLRLVHSKD